MDERHDVVIVGGGAIGSAPAYFLMAEDPRLRVAVVERDPTYARASSALSASGIRQQFSTPVNIALSRFGVAFLREAPTRLAVDGEAPALSFVEGGYLYLASAAGRDVLAANHRLQRAHGVDVALLDPAALVERFPWLSTDGVVAGSLGLSGEGWFDGYGLLQALRRKARSLGAAYLHAEAVGLERAGDRILAVRLADGRRLACGHAVNAAGPHARAIAAMAGVALPVEARARSVFVLDVPVPLARCPLVIDTSGVWFRPEGPHLICGLSPPEARDPERLELVVDHDLFEDAIWPALAHRVPALERLRVANAWAGHYEYNTVDQNGIVGRAPGVANLVLANGFSGHGIQHSPAVGRAVAELIVHGAWRTLDLAPLDPARLANGQPLVERNII